MFRLLAMSVVVGLLSGAAANAKPVCRHGPHARCAVRAKPVDPARFARPLTPEEMRAKPKRLSEDEMRRELDKARLGAGTPPSNSH